jgi:hypothetical protein
VHCHRRADNSTFRPPVTQKPHLNSLPARYSWYSVAWGTVCQLAACGRPAADVLSGMLCRMQVTILTRTMNVNSEHHKASGSSSCKAHRVRAAKVSHRCSCMQSTACDSGSRYIRAPSALLRAVAQPLPGPVSSARLRSPPSFACVRHRNKPAPELVRRHRITHACVCKVLATATAYPKRAHVPVPLTWLSTSVWL